MVALERGTKYIDPSCHVSTVHSGEGGVNGVESVF